MAAETATNGAVEPAKAKMGRPVGYPKSGGRRKGPGGAAGKEGREWLAKNSKALDVLARVASGKAVKVAGPTGKPLWHYPDWKDQKWAIEQILPRLVPVVTATEVSGPDGAPIATEALLPMEVAQRLALLFAAHQAHQPAPDSPPVIDVEPEPVADATESPASVEPGGASNE